MARPDIIAMNTEQPPPPELVSLASIKKKKILCYKPYTIFNIIP